MSTEAAAEVAVVEPQPVKLSSAASFEEVGARLALVKRALKECMDPGTDYGKIPGCGDKDVLFKAGAEKLKTLFQLGFSVKEKIIRDLPDGHREAEITLQFTHLPTGWLMGDGVGSCNTLERRMRREKGGAADVFNNVLKIAKKRALVDGILTVTGSSGLLTQDLEEDPELYQKSQQPARKPLSQTPPAKANGNTNGKGHGTDVREEMAGILKRCWKNEYQGMVYYFGKLEDGTQLQTTETELGEALLQTGTDRFIVAQTEPSPKAGKKYLKALEVPEEPLASEDTDSDPLDNRP